MRKILSVLLLAALIVPSFSFAALSGGSYRSSSSFSSSRSSSGLSGGSFRSSGSFGSSASTRSPSGLTSGSYKSSGTLFSGSKTNTSATKVNTAPSAPRVNNYYYPTQVSYWNPFSSNFFFWWWIFGNHGSRVQPQTSSTSTVATSTATTSTSK